jgi:hypothetical protein
MTSYRVDPQPLTTDFVQSRYAPIMLHRSRPHHSIFLPQTRLHSDHTWTSKASMVPPSSSPTPVPAAVGTGEFPYKWEEIAAKLGLESNRDIPNSMLHPILLGHWANLRDRMPLTPGTTANIIPADDKSALADFTNTLYTAMDCTATSKYERPTSTDRTN